MCWWKDGTNKKWREKYAYYSIQDFILSIILCFYSTLINIRSVTTRKRKRPPPYYSQGPTSAIHGVPREFTSTVIVVSPEGFPDMWLRI